MSSSAITSEISLPPSEITKRVPEERLIQLVQFVLIVDQPVNHNLNTHNLIVDGMAHSSSSRPRFSEVSVSEELKCPKCFELLTKPKVLSCGHNFCEQCLDDVMAVLNGREIECPICQSITSIPENGIQGLPDTNITLRNSIERFKAYREGKERPEIEKALDNGKPVVELMEKKIFELEKISHGMTLEMESIERYIHEKADQLCEVVRKQEVSLCSEVEEFYQRKQAIMHRHKHKLEELLSNASSAVQVAEELISRQTDASELHARASGLTQELEEVAYLNLEDADFNFTVDKRLVFNLNKQAKTIIADSNIGRISHWSIKPQTIDSSLVDLSQCDDQVVFKLGHKGSKEGCFKSPADVAVNEFGEAAIADFHNNRVQVFDSALKFLFEFGKKGSAGGHFNGPEGIAYTPYNNIVVFDSKNSRVQIFNRKGEFVGKLGQHGCKPGEFGRHGGVFVDSTGEIVVTDTNNNRVQVFHNNGELKLQFGNRGTEGFDQPLATVAMDNEYFTSDSGNKCIKVFNTEGVYVRQFGSEGSSPGEFYCPRGLAIDPLNKFLLVADSENHNIQVFNQQGRFLKRIPTKKVPVALAIMQNNYILVCSYVGNCVCLLSYA